MAGCETPLSSSPRFGAGTIQVISRPFEIAGQVQAREGRDSLNLRQTNAPEAGQTQVKHNAQLRFAADGFSSDLPASRSRSPVILKL